MKWGSMGGLRTVGLTPAMVRRGPVPRPVRGAYTGRRPYAFVGGAYVLVVA